MKIADIVQLNLTTSLTNRKDRIPTIDQGWLEAGQSDIIKGKQHA